MNLGTLFDGLGCFPFDHGAYPPQSDCMSKFDGIRSLIAFSTARRGHQAFSALPPPNNVHTLALKLFRGEPAISQLDWNFSPIHKSSTGVSTNVGSVLQWIVLHLQPAHG